MVLANQHSTLCMQFSTCHDTCKSAFDIMDAIQYLSWYLQISIRHYACNSVLVMVLSNQHSTLWMQFSTCHDTCKSAFDIMYVIQYLSWYLQISIRYYACNSVLVMVMANQHSTILCMSFSTCHGVCKISIGHYYVCNSVLVMVLANQHSTLCMQFSTCHGTCKSAFDIMHAIQFLSWWSQISTRLYYACHSVLVMVFAKSAFDIIMYAIQYFIYWLVSDFFITKMYPYPNTRWFLSKIKHFGVFPDVTLPKFAIILKWISLNLFKNDQNIRMTWDFVIL